MRFRPPATRRAGVAVLLGVLGAVGACTGATPAPSAPDADTLANAAPARSFGIWTPGPGECPRAVHDRYATIGPDGKRYPTWHPPVDPATGCSFGHEHGRDPRGSALYAVAGDLPFGYANERLEESGLGLHRHEDHVGHKIEWENDARLDVGGPGGSVLAVRCDVLTKLHQGTHSKDAFTNNLHELNYHIRCSDRTEMHVTMLTAIGKAGEFERSCGGRVTVGPATPANSPDGGGRRRIPDRSCLESALLVAPGDRSSYGALKESWELHAEVRAAEKNRRLASFNPYFQVFRPSRFFDPAAPDGVGRPAQLCGEVLPGDRRARGGGATRSATPAARRCGTPIRWAATAGRRRSPGASGRCSRRSTTTTG